VVGFLAHSEQLRMVLLECGLFAGQRQMLLERRDQYKTAAIRAKQAGNDADAVKHIRTAKVRLQTV